MASVSDSAKWKLFLLSFFVMINVFAIFYTIPAIFAKRRPQLDVVMTTYVNNRKLTDDLKVMTSSMSETGNDNMPAPLDDFTLSLPEYKNSSIKKEKSTLGDVVLGPFLTDTFCDSTVLIAVCSSIQNFERRDAIRTTWGQSTTSQSVLPMQPEVRVVFVTARPTRQEEQLQLYLEEEHKKYGDVLQFNFTDHYTNLTLKTLAVLRWSLEQKRSCIRQGRNCFKYFVKSDDDVFINVPVLARHVADLRRTTPEFITGFVMDGTVPVRDRKSKWYTPFAIFRGSTYPRYVSGTTYAMTSGVLERIVALSENRPVFWLEDVFVTGILGGVGLKIPLIHDDRFNYLKGHRKRCWYQTAISDHGLEPEDLARIWKILSDMSDAGMCSSKKPVG